MSGNYYLTLSLIVVHDLPDDGLELCVLLRPEQGEPHVRVRNRLLRTDVRASDSLHLELRAMFDCDVELCTVHEFNCVHAMQCGVRVDCA